MCQLVHNKKCLTLVENTPEQLVQHWERNKYAFPSMTIVRLLSQVKQGTFLASLATPSKPLSLHTIPFFRSHHCHRWLIGTRQLPLVHIDITHVHSRSRKEITDQLHICKRRGEGSPSSTSQDKSVVTSSAREALDCQLVDHDRSKRELDNSNALQQSWFPLGAPLDVDSFSLSG